MFLISLILTVMRFTRMILMQRVTCSLPLAMVHLIDCRSVTMIRCLLQTVVKLLVQNGLPLLEVVAKEFPETKAAKQATLLLDALKPHLRGDEL